MMIPMILYNKEVLITYKPNCWNGNSAAELKMIRDETIAMIGRAVNAWYYSENYRN